MRLIRARHRETGEEVERVVMTAGSGRPPDEQGALDLAAYLVSSGRIAADLGPWEIVENRDLKG